MLILLKDSFTSFGKKLRTLRRSSIVPDESGGKISIKSPTKPLSLSSSFVVLVLMIKAANYKISLLFIVVCNM